MVKRARRIAAVMAAAVLAGLLVGATASADHNGTYTIRIGRFLPGIRSAESMRFFAPTERGFPTVRVHEGDQIRFTSTGFHTATLLPVGEAADEWVADNATELDQSFTALQFDPDDGAGHLKQSPDSLIQNRDDCGVAVQPPTPCDFDGASVLNSGAALDGPLDFTAIVNVPAGNSFWVVCLVHPHVRLRVIVVDDADPTTDQATIDADRADKIAHDTDTALALDAKYEARQSRHRAPGGGVVWDVWQGVDTRFVALSETYPKRLNIRRGQRVRWHFAQLNHEIHTATFPLDEEAWFVNEETFNVVCDPDGDGTGGTDTPADFTNPDLCTTPGGIQDVEVDFGARTAQGTGNGVIRNNALENSGIRGPVTNRFESYDVRFPRRSGRNPFRFFCIFHGNVMLNRITVR
jgi:plastocyanin